MLLHLLSFAISFYSVSLINVLDITDGPYSVNTTLNSIARFSCILVADGPVVTITGAVWLVDGEIINHFPQLTDLGDYKTYSHLELPAELNRNTSRITIGVTYTLGNSSMAIFSDEALLLIQGVLDPPSWEVVKIINDNLSLQWSQPYSIDNVDIDNYHVVVSVNNSIVNDTIVSNDTRSLALNDIAMDQCTSVVVSVSASNEVGESETNTEEIYYLGVPDIAILNSSLCYSESDNITLELDTEMQIPCDDLVSPISVYITVYSLTFHYNITVDATSANSSNRSVSLTSVSIDNISPHNLYQVDYQIKYNGGETHVSNVVNISSFDTQFINVGKSTTDKLCVKCHFLKGSSSNSCALRITEYPVNEPSVLFKSENIHNDISSNWICSDYSLSFGANTSYEINVFDVEQATFYLTPIRESVYSSHFIALPIVVDDNTTSVITASESDKVLSPAGSTSTQLHSEGIMAHITSSLPTTSKDATVSSVVVITGAQSSLIENPGVIAACVVIGIVLITLTTITVTTCLFVARIVKKMKESQRHLCIPMGTNAMYGRGTSDTGLKLVDENHIYSEITSSNDHGATSSVYATVGKRTETLESEISLNNADTCTAGDEWVPNPTYSLGMNHGTTVPQADIIDINQQEDSNKSINVPVDTCPAYSLTCDKITENNKHVYEDLTHFV